MTLIVNQLESFDKSNLEMIRMEFAKLQKKLEDCQKEQDFFKPDIGETLRQNFILSEHLFPLFAYSLWPVNLHVSVSVTCFRFSFQETATTREL